MTQGESEESEGYLDPSSEIPEDEDLDYTSESVQGEAIPSLNSVDRFFDTETLLFHLKMTLFGHVTIGDKYVPTGKGLARTVVINKFINSLRTIINTENMLSFKTDDEINTILLEKAKEHIFSLYDEESVDEQDFEHIVNILDHPCEMFMGIVKSGEGSETARQTLTGNYQRLNDRKEEYKPAFRVGTENLDFLTVGGKRK